MKAERRSADALAKDRLQTWLRARARLAPDLLSQSPPWVRGIFEHTWAPMQALARQVDCLPPALWDFLLGCCGGFVSVTTGESQYIPGPATIRRQRGQRDWPVQNVAVISVEDLARETKHPLHVVGHLIDHHLGCRGDPAGLWFSERGGVTPALRQASARLPRLFELGYSVDEIAQASVQDYFAQSLAYYCRERRRLNVADPQITKWFRSTLWNEAFWRV